MKINLKKVFEVLVYAVLGILFYVVAEKNILFAQVFVIVVCIVGLFFVVRDSIRNHRS